MAISLSTEDKLEYHFYPVSGEQIQFRIKAPHDAHVALTAGPQEGEPMYEVFIGGWANSKSVIRKNRTKPDVVEVETPGILTNDEFRGFWIRWSGGVLTVGKEGEANPLMSYSDPDAPVFTIGYFGLCTGWGATGEWLIEAPRPEASAPPAVQGLATGEVCWCDASGGSVPPNAVEGGADNEKLYVGRANHNGAVLPGKVHPSHGVCYVAWGGEEHGKAEYQVLCGSYSTWVPMSGGQVPPNAIPGGETEEGEPLYVGRVQHEGTLCIGKIQPSHGVCYIAYGGAEVPFPDYEVLTH